MRLSRERRPESRGHGMDEPGPNGKGDGRDPLRSPLVPQNTGDR